MRNIANVDKITGLTPVAKNREALPSFGPRCKNRNHTGIRARWILAWTIHIEKSQRGGWDAVHRQRQLRCVFVDANVGKSLTSFALVDPVAVAAAVPLCVRCKTLVAVTAALGSSSFVGALSNTLMTPAAPAGNGTVRITFN
jgi:hypothetical protein